MLCGDLKRSESEPGIYFGRQEESSFLVRVRSIASIGNVDPSPVNVYARDTEFEFASSEVGGHDSATFHSL